MKHMVLDTSKTDGETKEVNVTPLKAIKGYCYQCCGGYRGCVQKMCTETNCWLYPYRFGKDPDKKGKGHIENIRRTLD